MSNSKPFEYDIVFSCLALDDGLARRLDDLLRDHFKTVVCSDIGLEGMAPGTARSDVISRQARCVVVLHRDGWGRTSPTRAEEIAIRNRAQDEGYDFALFISLDAKPAAPKWLPRYRLWNGLDRWGVGGAAAVIEARVQELGAEYQADCAMQATSDDEIQQEFGFCAA